MYIQNKITHFYSFTPIYSPLNRFSFIAHWQEYSLPTTAQHLLQLFSNLITDGGLNTRTICVDGYLRRV